MAESYLSEIELNFVNLDEKNKIIDEVKMHIHKYGFDKSANKFSISNTSLDGGNWVGQIQIVFLNQYIRL